MTMPTDPRYWDCECKANYMHPKSEPSCPECNTRAEDQPDSRINELLTTFPGYKLPNRERMP